MKKLVKIFSATIVSTAFMGSVASAVTCDGTITISNTGPGSNNTVSCTDVSNIVLNCTNNVVVGTVNTQTGTSGNGDTSNNTTGGNAVTGQVVNDNGNNVTIGGGCEQLAATPGTGSTGGGGGGGGGGAGAFTPEALPNTSTTSSAVAVLGTLASATGLVALSRLVVVTYRKLALR